MGEVARAAIVESAPLPMRAFRALIPPVEGGLGAPTYS
jgi:hypothetical protein